MSYNKDLNDQLLYRANIMFNVISSVFPALERVTFDDATFYIWQISTLRGLEKLFEEKDLRVNGRAEIKIKKEAE